MRKEQCCSRYRWKFIADASHADGCEFTYGQCQSCSSHLINITTTIQPKDNVNVIVSSEFIDALFKLNGRERKEYMRNWYNEL